MMIDDEMTEIEMTEIKTKDVITETGMIMMMNSADNSVTGDVRSVTMTEEETIMTTMLTGGERTETVAMNVAMIEMMIVTGESIGVIEMMTFDEM